MIIGCDAFGEPGGVESSGKMWSMKIGRIWIYSFVCVAPDWTVTARAERDVIR